MLTRSGLWTMAVSGSHTTCKSPSLEEETFNTADLLFELDEQHVLVGGGVPDDPQTVDV